MKAPLSSFFPLLISFSSSSFSLLYPSSRGGGQRQRKGIVWADGLIFTSLSFSHDPFSPPPRHTALTRPTEGLQSYGYVSSFSLHLFPFLLFHDDVSLVREKRGPVLFFFFPSFLSLSMSIEGVEGETTSFFKVFPFFFPLSFHQPRWSGRRGWEKG